MTGDPPAGQPVQRVEQILCRAAPARQFGDKDGVDPPGLGKFHDPGPATG